MNFQASLLMRVTSISRHLITSTIAMGCLILILFLGVVPIYSQQTSEAATTVNLSVLPTEQLAPPNLTLTPLQSTESILLTLGPVELIDGTILTNSPIDIYIRPEGRDDYIILSGTTDSEGIITFDSSQTPEDQGLTITGGDPIILTLIDIYTDIIDSYGVASHTGTVFGEPVEQEEESNRVNYQAPDRPEPDVTPRTGGTTLILGGIIIGIWMLVWIIIERTTRKKTGKTSIMDIMEG